MNDKYTSLELSKQLPPMETEHIWAHRIDAPPFIFKRSYMKGNLFSNILAPAPQFHELWALLPGWIYYRYKNYWLKMEKLQSKRIFLRYKRDDVPQVVPGSDCSHESPIEALTMLYLWLIREGYIDKA